MQEFVRYLTEEEKLAKRQCFEPKYRGEWVNNDLLCLKKAVVGVEKNCGNSEKLKYVTDLCRQHLATYCRSHHDENLCDHCEQMLFILSKKKVTFKL